MKLKEYRHIFRMTIYLFIAIVFFAGSVGFDNSFADEKKAKKYDSYIVGSYEAKAFDTEFLKDKTGVDYFNHFYYDGDIHSISETIKHIVEIKGAKTILLPISLDLVSKPIKNNNIDFDLIDLRYKIKDLKDYRAGGIIFEDNALFHQNSNIYEDLKKEVEPIGYLRPYLVKHSSFKNTYYKKQQLNNTEFLKELGDIVQFCESRKVSLTVILCPSYHNELKNYSVEEINSLLNGLSNITSYWDFLYSDISLDPRFFETPKKMRKAVGNMMISKITQDKNLYKPENFGKFIEKGTPNNIQIYNGNINSKLYKNQKKLKVLIMHSIGTDVSYGTVITKRKLESVLKYLKDRNYETVSQQQILDYVYKGIDLPENPVVLTFDDGYTDNYEIVVPMLKKYNAKAVFFPIGLSMGRDTYKETNVKISKHYGKEEVEEMLAMGNIEFGSHTYDMHQLPLVEWGNDHIRESVLMLENDDLNMYLKAMRWDFGEFRKCFKNYDKMNVVSFSYPLGEHDTLADILVQEDGFLITYGVVNGDNMLVKGLPQSLLSLKRKNISEYTNLYRRIN